MVPESDARLLKVIARAEFCLLPGFYAFEAIPHGARRPRPAVRRRDTG